MEHQATVFIFRPDGAFRLCFQMPASVDNGLRERNPLCWKGTIKYMEMQIARHLAERDADPVED